MDKKFPEAILQNMPVASVRSVSNVGHEILPLELSPHSVVNTLRLPPVSLQKRELIIIDANSTKMKHS